MTGSSSIAVRNRRIRSFHLMVLFAVWGAVVTTLISTVILLSKNPIARAGILMADGLVLFWIIIGGIVMWRVRDRVRDFVRRVPWDWRVKFVVFATLLALTEEAVTTTMTNLAPVLGVPVGAAYITASANYLDVVCFHSVIVFIPWFIAWAMVLERFDFPPNVVFLLFGLQGVLAETSFSGWNQLGNAGFWVYVYGLMIYLPAYSLPADRPVRQPQPWHYLLPYVLSFFFVIPVAVPMHFLHPVKIHFPPMQTGR